MAEEMHVDRVARISAFLAWAKTDQPNMMYGSHRIDDVWDSWCKLINLDPVQLYEAMVPSQLDMPL